MGLTRPAGPVGQTGAIGTNGKNTLLIMTPEPAGLNCISGETKIEVGLDDNNLVIDINKVNAFLTTYICNATNNLAFELV